MSIYAIADLHLSLNADKPMDAFGGWEGYVDKIKKSWEETVSLEDTVVIPGDISWSMDINDALDDFRFIDSLPGRKIILKGNHDYWWCTLVKIRKFLDDNKLDTIEVLHNNSYLAEGKAICGTRGWVFMPNEAHDLKISAREALRLEFSLKDAEERFPEAEKIVFLHYPPVYANEMVPNIMDVLKKYDVRRVYYGHLHGNSRSLANEGDYMGIDFRLISADHLNFGLYKIQ